MGVQSLCFPRCIHSRGPAHLPSDEDASRAEQKWHEPLGNEDRSTSCSEIHELGNKPKCTPRSRARVWLVLVSLPNDTPGRVPMSPAHPSTQHRGSRQAFNAGDGRELTRGNK